MIVGVTAVTSEYDLIAHLMDVATVEHAVRDFGIQMTLLANPDDRVFNIIVEPLYRTNVEFADLVQDALSDLYGLEVAQP